LSKKEQFEKVMELVRKSMEWVDKISLYFQKK
jgi:hypothetical protein